MMDRIEILASRIRRTLSRNRWLAAHIHGTVPETTGDETGLVLIQIDGLAHGVLQDALRTGHMPFLKHLIDDEGYVLRPMYSGLPSSTPGVQAELFYGVRTAVPSFAYYDRARGRVMRMAGASAAQAVEAKLEARDPGLLRGGAAWSNVFTGGAEFPHLCASMSGLRFLLRAMAPARLVALFLWHGWSILRVVGNLCIETGLALWDFVRGALAGAHLLEELRFVPLRVVVTAGMREIVTAGAATDTERGLPIIQLNYLGYDEHAHRRGPRSRFARWTLRGIDRSVRRVWLAAHRSRRRDYHVWIYSDHGQQTTLPYPVQHGEKLTDAVARVYRALRDLPAVTPDVTVDADRARVRAQRSEWLGPQLPKWIRPDGGQGADGDDGAEPSEVDASDDPIVVHEGPVGFVYLDRDLTDAERDRFADGLCRDAHVPIVLAPDSVGGAHVWLESGRRLSLPVQAAEVFGPEHPYLEEVTDDVLRLVHHEKAGALTLLGWNRQHPMSLQHENGAHGGPGPDETSAMLLLPQEAAAAAAAYDVIRPLDLREMARRLMARPFTRPGPSETARHSSVRDPSARSAEDLPRLRILTYNVHGCRGMDGKYSPLRIARVIARLQPDIICLQELDQSRARSGRIDQAREISAQLSADYEFHAVAELEDGRFGNAILTSLPMRLVKSGALPRVASRLALEDRGVLWVRVDVEGRDLHVINTHLSVHRRERHLQADALASEEWLRHPDLTGPTLLAGDFNASGTSPTAQRIRRVLRDVEESRKGAPVLPTWSGRIPLRRIDHVYVSGDFTVRGVHVPQTRLSRVASDHLPLVVDLSCCLDGRAEAPARHPRVEHESRG